MIKIDVEHQLKNIHFFETIIHIESKQKLIQIYFSINPILNDIIIKKKLEDLKQKK